MLYNFRFDRDNVQEILRRLHDEDLLCQGWGGGDQADLSLLHDDFVPRTVRAYGLSTTRIPTNLTRMRDLQDGDILVTPHLPEPGRLAVHVVNGDFPECYQYRPNDTYHLNHQIRVRHSHGLEQEISIYNALVAPWYGKLQWMRLPILPIAQYQSMFDRVMAYVASSPTHTLRASALDEYIESLRQRLLDTVRKDLTSLPPSSSAISFEAICERLLTDAGYHVESRHQYDSKGGDVDLRCVRSRSATTPFEVGDVLLLVQIKKHSDVTDAHPVRQLLPMLQKEPHADGCVMSLSDGFTPEAEQLASSHAIALLTAKEICDRLLALLAAPTGTPAIPA